jgi:hypothetical protein
MRHPALSILLTGLIAMNALLGGVQGGVAICFGGGHEHAADEVATECEQACEHEGGWPAPVAATASHAQDGECGCTDVEFTVLDLQATLRDGGEAPLVLLPAMFAPVITIDAVVPETWPCPPSARGVDDPGGRHRIAVVRSTRLNV